MSNALLCLHLMYFGFCYLFFCWLVGRYLLFETESLSNPEAHPWAFSHSVNSRGLLVSAPQCTGYRHISLYSALTWSHLTFLWMCLAFYMGVGVPDYRTSCVHIRHFTSCSISPALLPHNMAFQTMLPDFTRTFYKVNTIQLSTS